MATTAPDTPRAPGAKIPHSSGLGYAGGERTLCGGFREAGAALPGAEESAGTKFRKGLIGELARLHGWEKG